MNFFNEDGSCHYCWKAYSLGGKLHGFNFDAAEVESDMAETFCGRYFM